MTELSNLKWYSDERTRLYRWVYSQNKEVGALKKERDLLAEQVQSYGNRLFHAQQLIDMLRDCLNND